MKTNIEHHSAAPNHMAYSATTEDYDGAEDAGYQPVGWGATPDEAEADLFGTLADRADDERDMRDGK
jgi:hypothetical protein